MNKLHQQVLRCIAKEIEYQDSFAYFDIVCSEVLGELTEDNEKKLNKILDELLEMNRIIRNGDRLGLVESSILVIDETSDGTSTNGLEKTGLEFKEVETDIGHGCGVATVGIVLAETLITGVEFAAKTGMALVAIKEIVEAYEWVWSKIKEFFGKRNLYCGDDILITDMISKLHRDYTNRGVEIKYIQLKAKSSIKIGADGLYSEQNYCFRPNSLESSPDRIIFLSFEVWSNDFYSDSEDFHDYELINIQINSRKEIITENIFKITI